MHILKSCSTIRTGLTNGRWGDILVVQKTDEEDLR